jgi:hypothetical protein
VVFLEVVMVAKMVAPVGLVHNLLGAVQVKIMNPLVLAFKAAAVVALAVQV